jgi:hypothetical protein
MVELMTTSPEGVVGAALTEPETENIRAIAMIAIVARNFIFCLLTIRLIRVREINSIKLPCCVQNIAHVG